MPQSITELLQQALPKPGFLTASHGGPCLSLALHVLMVHEGFASEQASTSKPYAPQQGWHSTYMDQWVFRYSRPGKANKFVLHCSLQMKTMRMFVQATEEGNPENVQILGLQLDNYFPSTAGLKQGWGDSLLNEGKLIHFVLQHITVPLTAAAVDAQTEAGATPGSFLSAFSFEQLGWPAQASSVYTSRAAMAGIAAAVAVAGIAGVLVLSRGSRLPR